MRSLAELQRDFAKAIVAQDGVAPAVFIGGADSVIERMAIYRRAVFANYRNALAATYPVVRQLVGAPLFNAAVDAFVRARPSTSGDLNDYGDAFPAFLATCALPDGPPFLADVARLEWAIDESHRAADAAGTPDLVLASLAAVPADRLPKTTLHLAPSCRLLASDYPILAIWKANPPGNAGDATLAFDACADALLLRRDAGGIGIERLAPGDYAWLAAVAAGATFAAAIEAALRADAVFDLDRALHTHIGAATIVSIGVP
ncbi:MAG: DNA-binding domain-containing protein [Betaproteobacteria bacterium]